MGIITVISCKCLDCNLLLMTTVLHLSRLCTSAILLSLLTPLAIRVHQKTLQTAENGYVNGEPVKATANGLKWTYPKPCVRLHVLNDTFMLNIGNGTLSREHSQYPYAGEHSSVPCIWHCILLIKPQRWWYRVQFKRENPSLAEKGHLLRVVW